MIMSNLMYKSIYACITILIFFLKIRKQIIWYLLQKHSL